jgi:hypothetical protein
MPATNEKLASIYIPLRLTYGLVPLAAGGDKFFNVLTDWNKYLPADLAAALPMSPTAFMLIVGVIEIAAGLAVLTSFTRLGAYVVMAWLLLIAVNLTVAGYLDIAVRDVVMAVGAFALGQVSALYGDKWIPFAAHSEGTSSHAVVS